jgi:hypothetical protein
VEQPLKYELTLNLKTAKTLGPTIQPGVLASAERGDRTSAPAASWCDPAGDSPAQVRSSVRLVASVAATGDSGCEAYTAIAWGVGLSHERSDIAGAESLYSLEGNMCGTAMRGADALPGSKATSRAKGSHRKLGGLGFDRNGTTVVARIGKVRSRSR